MKLHKLVVALAACIALSSPVLAETAEERTIANCDWPESMASGEPAAEHDARIAKSNAAAKQEAIDEAIANCDWPSEESAAEALAEGEAERGSSNFVRSDDELVASCDWPEAV